MRVLSVNYAHRSQFTDYSRFHVVLRGSCVNWLHYFDSHYLVTTEHNADLFARYLLPYMQTSDSLLVVEIQPTEFQGWLPNAVWDWLNDTSRKSAELQSPWPSSRSLG
jgi:hypothetical protein